MKFTLENYLAGRIDECSTCPYPIWDRCNHRDCIIYDTLNIIKDIKPYYDAEYERLKQQELDRERDEKFYKELRNVDKV